MKLRYINSIKQIARQRHPTDGARTKFYQLVLQGMSEN